MPTASSKRADMAAQTAAFAYNSACPDSRRGGDSARAGVLPYCVKRSREKNHRSETQQRLVWFTKSSGLRVPRGALPETQSCVVHEEDVNRS